MLGEELRRIKSTTLARIAGTKRPKSFLERKQLVNDVRVRVHLAETKDYAGVAAPPIGLSKL